MNIIYFIVLLSSIIDPPNTNIERPHMYHRREAELNGFKMAVLDAFIYFFIYIFYDYVKSYKIVILDDLYHFRAKIISRTA